MNKHPQSHIHLHKPSWFAHLVNVLFYRKRAGRQHSSSSGQAPNRRISASRESQSYLCALSHPGHVFWIQSRPRSWRTISGVRTPCQALELVQNCNNNRNVWLLLHSGCLYKFISFIYIFFIKVSVYIAQYMYKHFGNSLYIKIIKLYHQKKFVGIDICINNNKKIAI